jgi:hypothetical protein
MKDDSPKMTDDGLFVSTPSTLGSFDSVRERFPVICHLSSVICIGATSRKMGGLQ